MSLVDVEPTEIVHQQRFEVAAISRGRNVWRAIIGKQAFREEYLRECSI